MIYSVGGCQLLADAWRNELALDMIYSTGGRVFWIF